ncbi:hypothetical protein [Pontibacter cellulosilyticus]|uniref:Uncharacterized protein n=1 Tax=Pontibacter cellulosilyticus TaxID=1720253 RepID=A0A923N742_9BACT|nr:hypothetical protein [Pontibacter cellulosilyticus]MBC5994110.1 hypothetical protein [Pontibacter cellulosilyticus]
MFININKLKAVNILLSTILFYFTVTSSLAQGTVLVHEFKLLNESPESLPEHGRFLTDSTFMKPVLEVLERGIRSKVGNLPIDYYSGRQIDLLSPSINPYMDSKTQFKDYFAKQKAYYSRFKKENRKNHQYLVTVHAEFLKPNVWESQENVKFKLKVKIKENGKGKVFKERESYSYIVKTPDLLMNELGSQSLAIYQNFALNKEEIQKAYLDGLEQIFFDKAAQKTQLVNRSIYEGYNDFIEQAERKYSLVVPATYGYSTLSNVKYRFLGIPVMAGKSKHSAVLAGELSESRKGFIQMKENRLSGITDLDIVSPLGTGYRQLDRNFTLSSELFPSPYRTYTLRGSIQDAYALGIRVGDPFNNSFRLDLYDEGKMLKSNMLVHNLGVSRYDEGSEASASSLNLGLVSRTKTTGAKSLHKILRNHGRIYTPYIKTEGEMLGKSFSLITNPLCLNNVEMYYGDEMVGLITHSKPTKKQLKKEKNFIPHMLYLKAGLTPEEEALILQNFQLMRVGYAMNNLQRGRSRSN